MLKRLVNIIIFTLAYVVAADASSPSCDEYQAVVDPSAGGGTIVVRTNGGCNWSFRAIPDPGYEFSRWSDGNTTNPRHYTIDTPGEDFSFTAEFVRTTFTYTVTEGDFGTVTAEQSVSCVNQWTLEATPNPGYVFTRWSDSNTDSPRLITLESDNYAIQEFSAVFSENWCAGKTVNASVDDDPAYDGSGTISMVRCNCDVYLTATPATGSAFVGWNDGNTDNPRVVVLEDQAIDSYTFKARFMLKTSLTCDFDTYRTSEGHGTVTAEEISDCSWKLTATPESGWEFTRWSDGNTANPRTVSLDPEETYIKYQAIFTFVACKPFRAVCDKPTGGTVSASQLDCNWTLTATPDDGYEFVKWSDGSLANPHVVTIDDPGKTQLIYTAYFRPYSCNYNTAVLDEGHGTITVVKKTCSPCVFTITATPKTGWEFLEWDDHNTDNPRDIEISDLSFDPDTKVSYQQHTATFVDSYCANVRDVHTDCAGGKIVATRRNGCEWLLHAVPVDNSYEFISWGDGHTGNPRLYDFERESASIGTISAKFAPARYYTIMKSGEENGTITATQEDCENGFKWTVNAMPNDGWEFSEWSDGSTDNPHEIVKDGNPFDMTVTFNGSYSKSFHPVVTNPVAGGTVSVENCNYTFTMTATPDGSKGYQFAGWEDGSIANPRTFDITPKDIEQEYYALFMIPDGIIDGWAYNGLEITTNSTDIFDGGSTGTATIYADETEIATAAPVTKKDWGRWFVEFDPTLLNSHVKEKLLVRVFDECGQLSCAIDSIVPAVITTNTTLSTLSLPSGADVQAVRGVLSIDQTITLRYLDIHANAMASLPSGKTLTVDKIFMRGNGPRSAYPAFSVNGKVINNNSNIIYYDYTLDYHAYYPLALPYTTACNAIRTKTGNTPVYEVSWYNGDDRALNVSGWTVYDDTEDGAEITAGQGYTIFAVPEQWKTNMQQSVVLRFPMVADLTASTGEPEKRVSVALYNYDGVTNESNKNWNLIGNPYLTNYSPSDNEKLMEVGYYIPNPSGTGYIDSGEKLRYLTWSVDGYRTYIQNRITETTMAAFRPYFVQAKVAGDLVFSRERRAESPRRQWMAEDYDDEPESIEYEMGVILTNDSISDRTGLLYGELFTQDYEMNADLVKMFGSNQPMSFYSIGANDQPRAFNALPLAEAGQPVPLGFRNAPHGTMQVAFDTAHYDASMFEAVWLIDYESSEITNLLDEPYAFHNTQSSSDTRFALFASPAAKPHTPTGTDILGRDAQGIEVYDMLGRRVDTDCADLPQGVYVVVENGKPRKEVVK